MTKLVRKANLVALIRGLVVAGLGAYLAVLFLNILDKEIGKLIYNIFSDEKSLLFMLNILDIFNGLVFGLLISLIIIKLINKKIDTILFILVIVSLKVGYGLFDDQLLTTQYLIIYHTKVISNWIVNFLPLIAIPVGVLIGRVLFIAIDKFKANRY